MNNRPFFVIILATWMLSLGGCGAEEPSIQLTHWPIIGGTLDDDPGHSGVVAIEESDTLCSGILIASRVVMTAAHCMINNDPIAYVVYFGNNVTSALDPQLRRFVSEFRVPEGYSSSVIGIKDIALLRLSSAPPENVTPIPNLPQSLQITQSDIDQPLEYIGYGKTSNVAGALDYGIKRTMTHNINWVCIDVPGDCSDLGEFATPNTICENQQNTSVCLGDSGGPALIVRNGKTYVAGISSFVGKNCQYVGCSTKVDAYESFIFDFTHQGLGASCLSPNDCKSGYCIDSVCCESTCEGTCMTCNSDGRCQAVGDGTSCAENMICKTGQCIKVISSTGIAGGCNYSNGVPTSLELIETFSFIVGMVLLRKRREQ